MKQLITVTACCLLLMACRKNVPAICGIWKVEYYQINGTMLKAADVGRPMMEFNDEGGYLINVSGAEERGTYKLQDNKLVLHAVSAEKPDAEFVVTLLDSTQMEYEAKTDKNEMKARMVRIQSAPEND